MGKKGFPPGGDSPARGGNVREADKRGPSPGGKLSPKVTDEGMFGLRRNPCNVFLGRLNTCHFTYGETEKVTGKCCRNEIRSPHPSATPTPSPQGEGFEPSQLFHKTNREDVSLTIHPLCLLCGKRWDIQSLPLEGNGVRTFVFDEVHVADG